MPSTSTVNMFEDNILIEIDGVASMWDTYCLGLNIVTPGSKRVIFRFKDIGKAIREGSSDSGHITNKVSSTLEADNIKTEPDLVETYVKFEEDDEDSINSVQKKIKLSNALSEYRTAGRKAVLTLNPFASVSLAFHYGMMLDKGGVSNSDISDEQQARYRTFYNGILDMIPGFRATLDEMSYDLISQRGIQRLQDGTWPLLSTNWPSFLYAADAIYDSEDPNIGLFRGHVGIRAFQHLYLGPAAAGSEEHNDDDSKHGRSKSKATMYGLTKVTPQAWAWAMCAAWFSLSACNSYKVCIGSFNLEDFFFAIIETLDDPEDPWAVETMAWINEQVFGKHAAKAMTAAADDTDSDLAKMRAKRAARKQGNTLTSATNNVVRSTTTSPPSVSAAERPSSPAPPLSPPRLPSQVTPSTLSPPRALTPLSDSESFPPSPAKQPPAIPTAILPKPVPVAHKKAKPVPRPKAKPAPKPRSNTRGSAHLSAGTIQVEEPTNEVGDAGILDVNAPAPPKKKPVPRRGKKAA
ncbi:hypothetical protein F4604DRAFT_1907419 [Suillus subluteus]|nr:hypothetical protein F4604DRAFT_1907419 [Suillus subluteus]